MSLAIDPILAQVDAAQRRRPATADAFRCHLTHEIKRQWEHAWIHLHAIAKPVLTASIRTRNALFWADQLHIAAESAAFFAVDCDAFYNARPQSEKDLVFQTLIKIDLATRS